MMGVSVDSFRKAVETFLFNRQGQKQIMPATDGDALKGAMLFSRHRSKLFVLPTVHNFPRTQLGILLPKIGEAILLDENLPARIEVYCSSPMTIQQAEELKAQMRGVYNVELEIFDGSQLARYEEFSEVLQEGDGVFAEIDETSKVLFSLLSEGSNVSEIKSNLICSIIIFLLSEKDSLPAKRLRELAEERLHHEIGSIEQEIDFLISKGRVERDSGNRDLLRLTKNERDVFQRLRLESKREEAAFHQEFMALLKTFHIPDGSSLIEQLKSLYMESCEIDIDKSLQGLPEARRMDQVFQEFRSNIRGYIKNEGKIDDFMAALKDICLNNPFLEKIGASEMFLSLYRSSKLEQFINSKQKLVYLDTRAFIYYYCLLASKGKNWPYWEDYGYRATANLAALVNKKKNKDIKIRLFETYIGEVVGELQKALRTAWFHERFGLKLKIPFQTQNVFYNYYLYLLDAGCMTDTKGIMKFDQFVRTMGFKNTNAESPTFAKDAKQVIAARLKLLDIKLMPYAWIEGDLYDETLKEWDVFTSKTSYQKSGNALKADTRQLLHLVFQPLTDNEKECEYYYASWDRGFAKMRDWVIERDMKAHAFFVYNPARMANRFALSHFNIDSKCITHEVFFYADSQFKLRQKIASLYDHVLLPYFGYKEEEWLDLVNLLVDLQTKHLSQHEPETGDDMGTGKLPLELVFDSIKKSLQEWKCSENDLVNYMIDKTNEKEVSETFEGSFKAIAKKQKYDGYIKSMGEALKRYAHKMRDVEDEKM